ncbi:hypothetical protein J0A68_15950 [Algoriphagus sp. H41]|uniref:Uncharacterized protein n=1 Tax=Algoriphagus oliviformis TaxID=2811231 RepID=A0ABS3C640_9BACT|nr:DUF6266 family protein [Algoriphagus oliviformis]MBN7812447.1 hypothetical protein [Algoriphagus oliviformis]
MARVTNSILEGLSGSVGDLVFYKIGDKTYTRRKPGKQSKSTKARTSDLKRRSQSVMTQTHAFLRKITHILRFGYQNQVEGASRQYHAAVSYTSKNCFRLEGEAKVLEIGAVKISLGTLLGPQNPRAERVPNGVEFCWTDNSGQGSAKATDEVFVCLLSVGGSGSEWEFLGSQRSAGKHVLPLPSTYSATQWHAWIAFSQENTWTKQRTLSDSVYLGMV